MGWHRRIKILEILIKNYVIMKNVVFVTKLFTFALCMVIMFGSCGAVNKAKLKIELAVESSKLPMEIGNGLTLTSIALNDDGEIVEYNIECNNEEIFSKLKQIREVSQEYMKYRFFNNHNKSLKIKDILDYEVGIRVIYNYGGLKTTIKVPYREFKELSEEDLEEEDLEEHFLKLIVKRYNKMCPNKMCPAGLGGGVSMHLVSISGDYVVYSYLIDEDEGSIENIRKNTNLTREIMLCEAFSKIKFEELRVIYKCNKNLAYKWLGNHTLEKCIITVSNSEIRKICNF